jgi:hypothetical protein
MVVDGMTGGKMTTSTENLRERPHDKRLSRLTEFPPHQRVIVELLLTPGELAYSELFRQIMASSSPLSQAQFDNAINELVRAGYLMSFFEDGEVYYLLEVDLKADKRDEISLHGSRPDSFLDAFNKLDELDD